MSSSLIVFLIFFFAVLISAPIFYAVNLSKNKKSLTNLKKSGEIIEAEITEILSKAIFAHQQRVLECKIIAEMNIDQIKHEFVSQALPQKNCDHLKKGDKVKILIDRQDPKQYYFSCDPNNIEY